MKQILKGTEWEQHEVAFARAINTTWQAIAFDALEMDPSLERDVTSRAEVTIDANRVEMYGNLNAEELVAWQKLYGNFKTGRLLFKLAKETLR